MLLYYVKICFSYLICYPEKWIDIDVRWKGSAITWQIHVTCSEHAYVCLTSQFAHQGYRSHNQVRAIWENISLGAYCYKTTIKEKTTIH